MRTFQDHIRLIRLCNEIYNGEQPGSCGSHFLADLLCGIRCMADYNEEDLQELLGIAEERYLRIKPEEIK